MTRTEELNGLFDKRHCLQCAFTSLARDLMTTKTDKKHGSRQESRPLLDRPAIDMLRRT